MAKLLALNSAFSYDRGRMWEAINDTLGTLQRRYRPVVGLAALFFLPTALVDLWVSRYAAPQGQALEPMSQAISGILSLLLTPILNAAILHICHADREQRALPVWTAVRTGLSVWLTLIVGYLAVSLAVAGWLLVGLFPGLLVLWLVGQDKTYFLVPFAIPALYMAARYGFMETLIVVRGRDAYAARRESLRLSKGLFGPMLLAGVFFIGTPLALEQFAPLLSENLVSLPAWRLPGELLIQWLATLINLLYLVFFFHWYSQREQLKDKVL